MWDMTRYQTPSIVQSRSIKNPKMSDVCLSSFDCRKCDFDWAFEAPSRWLHVDEKFSLLTCFLQDFGELIGSCVDFVCRRSLQNEKRVRGFSFYLRNYSIRKTFSPKNLSQVSTPSLDPTDCRLKQWLLKSAARKKPEPVCTSQHHQINGDFRSICYETIMRAKNNWSKRDQVVRRDSRANTRLALNLLSTWN